MSTVETKQCAEASRYMLYHTHTSGPLSALSNNTCDEEDDHPATMILVHSPRMIKRRAESRVMFGLPMCPGTIYLRCQALNEFAIELGRICLQSRRMAWSDSNQSLVLFRKVLVFHFEAQGRSASCLGPSKIHHPMWSTRPTPCGDSSVDRIVVYIVAFKS